MTSGFVLQRMKPRLLVPLKRAPDAGPVAPSIHTHLIVSGLHSPMRVTSATMSYTASGVWSTCTRASPIVPLFMGVSVLIRAGREQSGMSLMPPCNDGGMRHGIVEGEDYSLFTG